MSLDRAKADRKAILLRECNDAIYAGFSLNGYTYPCKNTDQSNYLMSHQSIVGGHISTQDLVLFNESTEVWESVTHPALQMKLAVFSMHDHVESSRQNCRSKDADVDATTTTAEAYAITWS